MKKIIQISIWPQKLSEEVFRKVNFHDWHIRVGENVAKRTKKYAVECWNPDRGIKKSEITEKNGIIFKRFPYVGLHPNFGFRGISFELLKELKKEAKKNEIIIHLHGYSGYLPYAILFLFGGKVPIIAQHHGSTHPLKMIERKYWTIIASPLLLMEELLEFIFLKKVDYFFVLTEQEKKDLIRFISNKKITIQSMGANFNEFKPINKMKIRKKLNLPVDKKIIIYAGRYMEAKGADKLIDAFNKIRKKRQDIILLMIGGDSSDSLYERATHEATIELGKIKHSALKEYLNTANVFVMYSSKGVEKYCGLGVTLTEALACNIPVVSTNLMHFPKGNAKFVGKTPSNENELVKYITYVIDNPKKYKNCRKIAEKYFDWRPIITNTIKVYEQINKIYLKNEKN